MVGPPRRRRQMARVRQAEEPLLVELSKLVAESEDGAQLLQTPYDSPICRLSYNHDVKCIEVLWHKYATSPQLRYVHETILGLLEQHNASKILSDDSNLPIIHAEDQRWIVEQWLPRAKAAGFKAVASVISRTFFGRVAIGQSNPSSRAKYTFATFATSTLHAVG